MIEVSLVTGLIILGFSFLYFISDKVKFPYTILLLIFGFFAKEIFLLLGIHLDIELNSEFIYSILLPFLLFGAALHINFHQFKLQYKTISFLATFGLFIAITTVGGLLALILGWNIIDGLLFGAIISATDPIAVLALFKSIGGPKRLALIADGESMLNDATAVVLFRLLLAIAIGQQQVNHITLFTSITTFFYSFLGSVFFGILIGYFIALFLNKIENSLTIETTLTLGASLVVFSSAEHFLSLSGVISAVVAGLLVGNFGGLRSPSVVSHFVQEFWDFIGHLSVSFVFFFATIHLDLSFFIRQFPTNLWVIFIVIISRAISVYFTLYITNRQSFFNDEPNIPLSWQHILNWGGLRGVIPLVLVFSLPESYQFKELFFDIAFAVLLFSLFINGSTIVILLKKLKLHTPFYADKIKQLNNELFDYEEAVELLKKGNVFAISSSMIKNQLNKWKKKERVILSKFKNISLQDYKNALILQSFTIERKIYENLLSIGELSEPAFYELDSQLDLQWDAIEFPEISPRGVDKEGKIKSSIKFRQKILQLRKVMIQLPLFSKLFGIDKNQVYFDRFMLIRARAIGSKRVSSFLLEIKENNVDEKFAYFIDDLINKYRKYINKALVEIEYIRKNFPISTCEERILKHLLVKHHSEWVM